MPNGSLIQKLMGLNPHAEMIVRRLYRSSHLHALLRRFKPTDKSRAKAKASKANPPPIDFESVLSHLRKIGVGEGDLLIVHSAYRPLKPSRLSPIEVVEALKHLVGEEGTLAMPVIRKFAESPSEEKALEADISDITFVYDVDNTPVWTGAIPKALMKHPDSITSLFPLNTLSAWGPHAEAMMEGNLEGELPAPNGPQSAWRYAMDKNAWVVSIGTDLTHSLTAIHTSEDMKRFDWPVEGWYRHKRFRIVVGDEVQEKVVLERHPRWGMLHFGERKLCHDLILQGVMSSDRVEGLVVETLRAKALYEFLNARNSNGYPYFWLGSALRKP